MPQNFNQCVAEGGRVRTINPKPGTYLHVCYPKGGGSPVSGEVKKSKYAAFAKKAERKVKKMMRKRI